MPDLFPDAPLDVSIEAQLACVEREIRYRKGVYPRLVSKGKRKQEFCDREIALMTAVRNTLLAVKDKGPEILK